MSHLLQYKRRTGYGQYFVMETSNDILLDVNQHRLLMCCRMAKALGKGEIHANTTTHKTYWYMEKDDRITGVFHSMEEMEEYLEHLLENRSMAGLPKEVARRSSLIMKRKDARTNGCAMLLPSRINRM